LLSLLDRSDIFLIFLVIYSIKQVAFLIGEEHALSADSAFADIVEYAVKALVLLNAKPDAGRQDLLRVGQRLVLASRIRAEST